MTLTAYSIIITAKNFTDASIQLLIAQNAEIKQQTMLNTRLLQELVKTQRGLEMLKGGHLPDNMRLPLKSSDEVTIVEQQLRNQDIYKQLVTVSLIVFCYYMLTLAIITFL